MSGCAPGDNIPGHPRVVVHPVDGRGGRRVRVGGQDLGRAYSALDVLEFLRRAGLDPDTVDLHDEDHFDWRGGDPTVWTPL
ncbi:hypothetical protein [Streptomyces sp. Isolate_45]|uniref:hypothetical protein n=1 Tax=Streptomyces sp. Isolate_45 TaxID=2950111 RepID=UPI0024820235|nr:hypothetical protein [Streptomyces sp. Isolate_45]MDA5279916.1 hypothetical protein [Streptomyces sp. Isolate_45]